MMDFLTNIIQMGGNHQLAIIEMAGRFHVKLPVLRNDLVARVQNYDYIITLTSI